MHEQLPIVIEITENPIVKALKIQRDKAQKSYEDNMSIMSSERRWAAQEVLHAWDHAVSIAEKQCNARNRFKDLRKKYGIK